jgi:hypothetical protein
MLRRSIGLGVVCMLALLGCKSNSPSGSKPVAVDSTQKLSVEAPITKDNLTVWLVRGPDRSGGKNYLTLSEAMVQKKLIVHETGNVNELAVENVSDQTVFIPAGSIVKGGQQDRTLGSDLIITKADGKMPIAAFCVEQGRWAQRGGEDVRAFSDNTFMASGKAMKLSSNIATTQPSQGEVWNSIAKAQDQLSKQAVAMEVSTEVAAASAGEMQAENASRAGQRISGSGLVMNLDSATSYQLTMETPAMMKLTEGRKAALIDAPEGRGDVVGYVYAVNNKIAGGNVYASPALFAKLWPMLLDSAVVESIAEAPTTRPTDGQPTVVLPPLPSQAEVAAALADRDKATKTHKLNERTTVNAYDRDDSVMTDTLDQDGAVLSRTLLTK